MLPTPAIQHSALYEYTVPYVAILSFGSVKSRTRDDAVAKKDVGIL